LWIGPSAAAELLVSNNINMAFLFPHSVGPSYHYRTVIFGSLLFFVSVIAKENYTAPIAVEWCGLIHLGAAEVGATIIH